MKFLELCFELGSLFKKCVILKDICSTVAKGEMCPFEWSTSESPQTSRMI